VSRRPRKRAGRRSAQGFGPFSTAERRQADLFFADLVGPAADGLVESVRGEMTAPDREADLFWTDLLGRTRAWPGQRPAPSALLDPSPVEWNEGDEADPSSMPDETFGSDNVRISLRNDDGTPAAGVAFRAQFRDGNIQNGTLDARGEATIADHTHGDVVVTFPGLPPANWEIDSFGGSGG